MGEYDKSIAYAEEALKGNSLSDIADFHKIWTDESDAGVMLRLPIPNTSTLKVGDYFNQYMDNQYKSEFVAVKSFAELYDQENDIRFSAYLEKSFWKKQEAYHVIKYVGAGVDGHDRNQVGLKVMRVSEMYLNIAEASLRKSVKDETKANQMLSGLLTNRIEGYTHIDLSGDALLNEVMKQRRLELFCEWDRYSTLKRLSLGVHRVDEGENADGTGRKNLETTLESNDFRWLFPILISELDANANMRDQQNPGY